MFKKGKKNIAILVALTMLMTLLVPLTVAHAAASYTTNPISISSGGTIANLRVIVEVPKGSVTSPTDTLKVRLPKDTTVDTVVYTAPNTGTNQFVAINAAAATKDSSTDYTVTVARNNTGTDTGLLYLDFANLKVPSSASGDFKIAFEPGSSSGSAFSAAEIVAATVGTGTVSVTVEDVQVISSGGGKLYPIRVKEDREGALQTGGKSLKFKLPPGFTWSLADTKITEIWDSNIVPGTNLRASLEVGDARTLNIALDAKTDKPAYLKFSDLGVIVDETTAKAGDVKVAISGDSTVTPSEAVIARYGEFGAKVSAYGDPLPVMNGRDEQKLGKFIIEENIPGSVIAGRTITLTLPEGVKWSKKGGVDSAGNPSVDSAASDVQNVGVNWGVIDTDRRVLRGTFTVGGASNKPAKIVLKDAQVAIGANFAGDEGKLNVEVGGSAGLTGKLQLGKVTAPIKLEAQNVPELKIGQGSLQAGEVTVSETQPEAIMSKAGNDTLYFELPAGVFFSKTPKFEVVEGDLELLSNSASTNIDGAERGYTYVKTKSTSIKPSKIKISDIQLTVNRTVAEGDITLISRNSSNGPTVSNTALNEVGGVVEGYSFPSSTIGKVTIAKIVTPAPSETKSATGTTFKIGDNKVKIGGKDVEMEAAPYIKDGRTYLPVRYVAMALGVDKENILWNSDTSTVTLIKGSIVAQLVIGSNELKVNGASIAMDVAPEISNGRTMLPFRFIAQALGAAVEWNEKDQTVTVK